MDLYRQATNSRDEPVQVQLRPAFKVEAPWHPDRLYVWTCNVCPGTVETGQGTTETSHAAEAAALAHFEEHHPESG